MATTRKSVAAGGSTTGHPHLTRLVVPVDDTPGSTRAIELAARLGAELGLPLSIVSVIDDFRSDAAGRVAELRTLLGTLPDEVERKIVQARAPGRAIAEESTDGIVCMATSAATFDDNGVRGSVTEFVTRVATSPVIVLGPRCPENVSITRVVVGIDPSHEQTGLTHWSTRLAYQLGVPVDFVHVDAGDSAELGPKVRRLDLDASETVAHRLIEEANDALLAVGSHGHSGWQKLMQGSVAAELFANATQPVMVLGPNVAM